MSETNMPNPREMYDQHRQNAARQLDWEGTALEGASQVKILEARKLKGESISSNTIIDAKENAESAKTHAERAMEKTEDGLATDRQVVAEHLGEFISRAKHDAEDNGIQINLEQPKD